MTGNIEFTSKKGEMIDGRQSLESPNRSVLSETAEVMYTFRSFSPQQADLINQNLPDAIRNAHIKMKEGRGLVIPNQLLLSALLEGNLPVEERQRLEKEYQVSVSASHLSITPLQGDLLGSVSFNIDWQTGQIKSLVSALAPSVISRLYQSLRQKSPFINEVFQIAKIPELTDMVTKQAEEAIENNKKELARLSLIQPETTGVCVSIDTEALDPAVTTVVGQKGYAFGHPLIPQARILQTYGLADCVAVIAYDQKKKAGFLAHLDRSGSAREAFNLIRSVLGDDARLIIYGGLGQAGEVTHTGGSRVTLEAIYNQARGLKIIGKETLGNVNRTIALDTQTGRIFIPEKIKTEDDRKKQMIDIRVTLDNTDRLTNDGPFFEPVYEAIKQTT